MKSTSPSIYVQSIPRSPAEVNSKFRQVTVVNVPPPSVLSVINRTLFLPRTRTVSISLVRARFPSGPLRPVSPSPLIKVICAGVPAAKASRMHVYASIRGVAVVGHPAVELAVSQTSTPEGAEGTVAVTELAPAVESLERGFIRCALIAVHAEAMKSAA